ncbi:hypothetical protein AXF42_Ash019350 [Apostasia shenzhenica]|uniref:Uncharacterized protein n=1 Tax=Apostasia shenzhenica TaxID=1088818 RepID=A0A2H9ZTJ4_9ASPA|nr:hypothetical protein AXF42_Ash019350 [Apostasia shenzhenica]
MSTLFPSIVIVNSMAFRRGGDGGGGSNVPPFEPPVGPLCCNAWEFNCHLQLPKKVWQSPVMAVAAATKYVPEGGLGNSDSGGKGIDVYTWDLHVIRTVHVAANKGDRIGFHGLVSWVWWAFEGQRLRF